MRTKRASSRLDDYRLDDQTIKRLCLGLDPADAPPGYRRVAEALCALRQQPASVEPEDPDQKIIAAMVAAALSHQRRPKGRGRQAKVAVLAAAGLLSVSGIAAAATGGFARPPTGSPAISTAGGVGSPATFGALHSGQGPGLAAAHVSSSTAASATARPGTTVAPPAPMVCTAATNHGQYVSSVAHTDPATGAAHGDVVSQAAQSTCGKPPAKGGPDAPMGAGAGSPTSVARHPAGAADKTGDGAAGTNRNSHGHGPR
jgi:hypothetical protein